jgi:formylglycine-generating enzyme required for sulfatase activity/Tfp pilus assembly protein PilF
MAFQELRWKVGLMLSLIPLRLVIGAEPKSTTDPDAIAHPSLLQPAFEKTINETTAAIGKNPRDGGAYRKRGTAYCGKGMLDMAIADLDQAIRIDKDDWRARYSRGYAYGQSGQTDKAIADFAESVRLNPASSDSHFSLGTMYLKKDNFDKAIAEFTQSIRINPNLSDAYFSRGFAYCKHGERQKGIRDYTEGIRLNPKDAAIYYNRAVQFSESGDVPRAYSDFAEAIKLDPKNPVFYLGRGSVHVERGTFEKAIADYSEAIRLDSKLAEAYYGRSMAYVGKGDTAKAEVDAAQARNLGYTDTRSPEEVQSDFEKTIRENTAAIGKNPRDGHAYRERGTEYGRKGMVDKAIADLDQAIRLDKEDWRARYCRGIAYQQRGETDKAIVDFAESVRLNPASAESHFALGTTHLKKGDLDNAIAEFSRAIRINPQMCEAYVNRGIASCKNGYRQKGIADYTEGIRLNPKDAGIYDHRAAEFLKSGNLPRAESDFTEAIRLDPKDPIPYVGRGSVHFKRGAFEKAIADYSEAIRLDPKGADAYYGRSLAYEGRGDMTKAGEDLVQAKKLGYTVPGEEPKGERHNNQITNSIGMKLTLVRSGEFMMGSEESAEVTAAFFNKTYGENGLTAGSFKDELPQHRVRITMPFYLGTYHVTRGQFRRFVKETGYETDAEKGENKGAFGFDPDKNTFAFNETYSWQNAGFEQTDEHPVVNVSWNDAVEYCKWLSKKERKTYRLPTEAEWEYACRAGTTTRYYSGDDPETLSKVGNVIDAAFKARFPPGKYTIKANDGYVFTAPVGQFRPNAFGLYDMHGNALQWCADRYGAEYYSASSGDDPTGPDSGKVRVLRGGSWCLRPTSARSAKRSKLTPVNRNSTAGFRVARDQ